MWGIPQRGEGKLMTVKGNHPLAEIIAKKLFGVGGVPYNEQAKMINRACKEAVKYHNAEIEQLGIELDSAISMRDKFGRDIDALEQTIKRLSQLLEATEDAGNVCLREQS
jgi:hypothetical protein